MAEAEQRGRHEAEERLELEMEERLDKLKDEADMRVKVREEQP